VKVKPVLGDWEIPRIEAIASVEARSFVELPIPGKVGSLFQDMNSAPTRVRITGSLYGDEARDQFLEEVRGKFREGAPLTFVADIVNATEVQYVIIEALHFAERGTHPDQTAFDILIRESPPPPPPDTFGGLDTSLLDQAAGLLDTVTGALDAIAALGNVPDFQDPTGPLSGALSGLTEATQGLDAALQPLKAIFGSAE
jgi:hypothetical protein